MGLLVHLSPRSRWIVTLSRWLGASCFIIVVALALAPSGTLPKPAVLEYDKLNHALAFAALSGLFAIGWPSWPRWFIAVTFFSVGVAIELLQSVELINREFYWLDVAANAVGIAIGLGLAGTSRLLSAHPGASFAGRT